VVVNAPATGEVRRVFAREGMQVAAGDPLLEIVVRTEPATGPRATPDDPVARAAQTIRSSGAEVEAARAEVVRTEVEVQRLTPLVAAGQTTQGELDGARAQYERAQQRLRQAQAAEQNAQGGLVAARRQAQGGGGAAAVAATPVEQVIVARAAAAGTVSVVSARPGDRVTQGQAVATLRAN
jgi:multidrug resistance efflux pump